MDNHDDMITQFCGVTGAPVDRGQFYLESSGWNLEIAIETFFEQSDNDDIEVIDDIPVAQNPAAVSPSGIGRRSNDDSDIEIFEDEQEPRQQASSHTGAARAQRQQPPTSKMSDKKFATLFSQGIKKGNQSGSSSEDEDPSKRGEEYYVGGSDRSGQAVIGPPRGGRSGQNPGDLVKDLFSSAREHGAEEMQSQDTGVTDQDRAKRGQRFVGTGYRLGASDNDHEKIPDPVEVARSKLPKEVAVRLKLWKNGFSVDDGALREYRTPEGQAFLQAVMRGQIPPELTQTHPRARINLDMEDHKEEDFKEPAKPKARAFAGAGYSMADATSSPAVAVPSSSADAGPTVEPAKLDDSKPVTSVQVRMPDGSRLVAKLNTDNTVMDLRSFIASNRPELAARPFGIFTTFPNKELDNDTSTLIDSNLLNAVVVIRLK